MFDQLLKPGEVAQILAVSRSLAYRLLKTGEIPSIHLGRSVRVRPQDLELFISRNRTGNQVDLFQVEQITVDQSS